jgi:GH25 family lysozyme M1 (1,4-beta-N-acetylmuramidase)
MKKVIPIVIVLTILVLLSIFGFKYYKENNYDKYNIPEEVVFEYNNEVDVFSKVNYFSLITNKNVEILSLDELIDTNSTGTKQKKISIEYKKKKYYLKMSVNVKDVTEPIVLSYSSNITTTLMNVTYPCDKALYIDDYDNKPTCVINGDVSYDKVGSYPLTMTISDKAGNEVVKDVTVKVIEPGQKSSSSSNNSKPVPLQFSDIIQKYKNDSTMIGIDVSKWQGNIDFDKVKEAGCEFVIIRIGVQAGRNYDYNVDGNYKTYIEGAKRAGLKVGVYVYTTALNFSDGVQAADFVINTLDGESLDLGVAYDWENYQYLMNYEVSLHDLCDGYKGFKERLEKAHIESHFYASKYYLEKFWIYINEPVWLAHYASSTTYQGKYYMWQITGNGKIDGINDNYVDIDILYK